MKTILTNWKNYFIPALIALIIILLFLLSMRNNKIQTLKNNLGSAINLSHALTDSVHHYRNKHNEIVNEKLTLQASLNTLNDKNMVLTLNQKQLLANIADMNKRLSIYSAAQIDMMAHISNMYDKKPIVETDSSLIFKHDSDTLNYIIEVNGVKPTHPELLIKDMSIPNRQFVSFNWSGDKKEGYPVTFNVTNSNPLFKIANIDSYAIPEIKKSELKPTFWNKLHKFGKTTGGKIMFFGAGVVAGGLLLK